LEEYQHYDEEGECDWGVILLLMGNSKKNAKKCKKMQKKFSL